MLYKSDFVILYPFLYGPCNQCTEHKRKHTMTEADKISIMMPEDDYILDQHNVVSYVHEACCSHIACACKYCQSLC